MSDSYQPIYDAVRSRIPSCDIGGVVERFMYSSMDFSHSIRVAADSITAEHTRPSVLFRPKIYLDGDKWCALYGEDIQSGVCGFSESPGGAMLEFDRAWYAKKERG